MDAEFGLADKGLHSVVLVALGRSSAADFNAALPKSRLPASVSVAGRKSAKSLYKQDYVTFEADSVYNQRDAEGFIKLNALRLRIIGRRAGL